MGQENNLLFLNNFNKVIDNISEEIEKDKYMKNSHFYSFIKNAMDVICQKMSYQTENTNRQITVIQEDKMFEVILDFFKSINIEFYNKALEILKNKYPNTRTYIYDFHRDDPNHLTHYCIHYEKGKAEIFLPLRYRLSENQSKEIDLKYGENFYTIDDLYSITHEISHLFDIKPENTKVAMGGFYTIIKDGKPFGTYQDIKDSRTAIGISSKDNIMYILVVEGEFYCKSEGLSFAECGDILLKLKVDDAIQMDGGGSVSLCIAKRNVLSYKSLRKTAINLSIVDPMNWRRPINILSYSLWV